MNRSFISWVLVLCLLFSISSGVLASAESASAADDGKMEITDDDVGFGCIVSENGDIYWRAGKDSCAELMKLNNLEDGADYIGIHVVADNDETYPYLYPEGSWKMLSYQSETPSWFSEQMEADVWSTFEAWKDTVYNIVDYKGLRALSPDDTLQASPVDEYVVTEEDIEAFTMFIKGVDSLVTYMRNSVTKTIANVAGPCVSTDAYNYVDKEVAAIAKSASNLGTTMKELGVSNVGVMQYNFYAAVIGSFFDVDAKDWVYYAGAAEGYPYAAAMYLWENGMFPSQDSTGVWRLHAADGGKILYEIQDDEVSVKNAFAAIVDEDGAVYWKAGLDNVDLVRAHFELNDGDYVEVQIKPVLETENASFSLPDGNNQSVTRIFPYLDSNAEWTIIAGNEEVPDWYGDAHKAALMATLDEWKADVYTGLNFESAKNAFSETTRSVATYTDEDIALLAEWAAAWYNISEKGIDPTAAIILSGYERVGSNLWDDFDSYLLSSWRAVHSECPGTVVTNGYFMHFYPEVESKDRSKPLQNAVADSVSDVMEALAGYYFSNIDTWAYYDGNATGYPFAAGAELVLRNLVPFTDGEYWYFSSGEDAEIVFKISAEELSAM